MLEVIGLLRAALIPPAQFYTGVTVVELGNSLVLLRTGTKIGSLGTSGTGFTQPISAKFVLQRN